MYSGLSHGVERKLTVRRYALPYQATSSRELN
jgi:hypothetical protein